MVSNGYSPEGSSLVIGSTLRPDTDWYRALASNSVCIRLSCVKVKCDASGGMAHNLMGVDWSLTLFISRSAALTRYFTEVEGVLKSSR